MRVESPCRPPARIDPLATPAPESRSSPPTRTSPSRPTPTSTASIRRWRDRAPRMVRDEKLGDVFVDRRHEEAGADGPRRRRRASRPRRSAVLGVEVRGAAPRRLGSRRAARRPGPRRRRRRDHLPDRRHGALQPPRLRLQEGLLRRLQPLDRRVLRAASRRGCSAAARPRCARPRRASPTSSAIRDARPARRDDARATRGVEDYDSPDLRPASGRPRSSSACRSRSTS